MPSFLTILIIGTTAAFVPLAAGTLTTSVYTELYGLEYAATCDDPKVSQSAPLASGCNLQFSPEGGQDVYATGYANAEFGNLSAGLLLYGNLSDSENPYAYSNNGKVSASFTDFMRPDLTGPGFIEFGITGSGDQSAWLSVNGIEYGSFDRDFSTGLIPVEFDDYFVFKVLVRGEADSDGGGDWWASIASIKVYDSQGQRTSGFGYWTNSDHSYAVDGGQFTHAPEPSTWMMMIVGLGSAFWKVSRRASA